MSRVFITQETSHDFRQAEEFGDLIFMSDARIDDFHNLKRSQHNARLIENLLRCLKRNNFDQEKDYVIMVGSPYVQAAVSILLGRLGCRKVNLLRWDGRDLVYIPLTLDFMEQV